MKKSAILILLFILTVPALAGSKAYDLIKYMPEDALFAIASSGLDNLSDDFEQTFLGQIINDPQTKSLYDFAIRQIAVEAGDEFTDGYTIMTQVCQDVYDSGVFNGPLTAGVVVSKITNNIPNGYVYLALKGGKAKEQAILNLIDGQLKKYQQPDRPDIPAESIAGYEVSHVDFANVGGLVWWVKGDLLVVSMQFGNKLEDFVPKLSGVFSDNRALPRSISMIEKYTDGSDDIIHFVNGKEYFKHLKDLMRLSASQSGLDLEQLEALDSNFDGAEVATRIGFKGKQFVSDSITCMTDAAAFRTLHSMAFEDLDISMLHIIGSDMTGFFAADLDIDQLNSYYDTFLESPLELPTRQMLDEFWTEAQNELGIDVKSVAESFTGECMFAWKIDPQAGLLGSNVSFITKAGDAQGFVQIVDKMLEEITESEEFTLAKSSANGVEIRKVTIPAVSFFGLTPTLAVCEGHIIVSTSDTAINSFVSRIQSKAGVAGSIVGTDKYKAVAGKMAGSIKTLGYNNSEEVCNGLTMIVNSYYPLAVLGASQSGINLPATLPNYGHIAKDMPSFISWTEITDGAIHNHCLSATSKEMLVGVSGTSLAVSILMPALARAKTQAKVVVSQANLKIIGTGCVIFANENMGRMPESLDELEKVDISDEHLICPICGEQYTYIGKGMSDASSYNMILAYSDCMGSDTGYLVLYSDGRVNKCDADTFIAEIIRNNQLRQKEGLSIIDMDDIYYDDYNSLGDYYSPVQEAIESDFPEL